MGERLLNADFYHDPIDPRKGDQPDGFNTSWDETRKVYGVKLRNDRVEIYISLVAHPRFYTGTNYAGAVTSILLKDAPRGRPDSPDNMLCPFEECPEKLWGQLRKVVFFPPPWQMEWFYERSLLELDKEYELIYANNGLMRALITLRSGPFTIQYSGAPFFKPGQLELNCHLYRIIHVFPEQPFYTEELFVLTENGYPLSFRPYYYSKLHHPAGFKTDFARFETTPDYFAIWKHFIPRQYYGYGFASDAHIRGIELNENEIRWRLPLSYHQRCIHYFMFEDFSNREYQPDLFHAVGHFAWYERVFKPLEVIPVKPFQLAKRYSLLAQPGS